MAVPEQAIFGQPSLRVFFPRNVKTLKMVFQMRIVDVTLGFTKKFTVNAIRHKKRGVMVRALHNK